MAKSNNTVNNNNNTKENKNMEATAKKKTTRTSAPKKEDKQMVAAKKAAEKVNARAGIEKAIDRRLKFKKAIMDAFANESYGTFDFSKLKGRKVMDVFNDETTRKVIEEYYKLCDEVKSYTEKYPDLVKDICSEKVQAIKKQQEIDRAMATLKKLGVNVTINKEDK